MRCLPLADDCGVSNANTDAIAHCIDAGALAGASVLAAGAVFERGAAELGRRIAANPALRAGVHLNLLEGRATSPPEAVPLLADGHGNFRRSLAWMCFALPLLSARAKAAFNEQAALEWRAQIDAVRGPLFAAAGKETPLYLDGHQHVHAVPTLRPALAAALEHCDVAHVRVPQEPRYACPAPLPLLLAGTARRELLAYWGRSLRPFLAQREIPAPDFFIGAFCSGSMNRARLQAGLAAVAAKTKAGDLVEIMFHPGGDAALGGTGPFSRFYAAPEREEEKALLLSPDFRRALAKHDPSWQEAS